MRKDIVVLHLDALQNLHSTVPRELELESQLSRCQIQQRLALLEELPGPLDLKLHQRAESLIMFAPEVYDLVEELLFSIAKTLYIFKWGIHSVFAQISLDILPEIRQLESSANMI